jgi:putative transposase
MVFFARNRGVGRMEVFSKDEDYAALRANLVESAEAWRWGSLWRRVQRVRSPLLTAWPLPEPRDWPEWVNQPQTEAELESIRRS